ncbi:hypothetical protein BN2497_8335 [Janthinobacterium sp. CG23_2]|nr:hypothetical protein BN2497_8335 [Janthinobacterium sp. CG23_2]CUU30565.1 hypothetical protein BN3177_8335 [Janthinobacterium sp. CG23_2]
MQQCSEDGSGHEGGSWDASAKGRRSGRHSIDLHMRHSNQCGVANAEKMTM